MKWKTMESAPKDAREVLVLVERNGIRFVMVAHWASDLSGEEQPAFRGWFYNTGYGYNALPADPKMWHPLPELPE